jgi:hypothetical protein
MAVTIKTNSPLQSGDTTVVLSDKLNELWFTESSSTVYAVILRKNSAGDYDVLTQYLLKGYNNGTNYDYRVNLDNHIKIEYNDLTFNSTSYGGYVAVPEIDLRSRNFILLSTVDILAANAAIIVTRTNGTKYVTNANMSAWTSLTYASVWTFQHFPDFIINAPTKAYVGSHFIFNLGLSTGYIVDYLKFYNSAGTELSGGWVNAGGHGALYTTVFTLVPDTTYSIKYRYTINSVQQSEVTLLVSGCAKNQYFYFGESSVYPIADLTCTGKRETIRSRTNKSLLNGGITKIYEMAIDESYEQNIGFNLSESNYLDVINSPFICELVSSTFNHYLLQAEQLRGYNTRKLSERNDVLTLTKRNSEIKRISIRNNFYD